MPGISQPIQDVLAKLATLQVVNQDGQSVSLYSRIWNNQPQHEEKGKGYAYSKPAAFVEVINEAHYHSLGENYQASDIGFRLHLIHEYYNADGTFEQDLTIFSLRDSIVALLSLYQPTNCGPMVRTGETQEYDHDNVYHYIIDFVTHFIDSKGSKYDPATGAYIYYGPPGPDTQVTATKS